MGKDFCKIFTEGHVEEFSQFLSELEIFSEVELNGELVKLYEHLKKELLNRIRLELYNIFEKPETFSIVAKEFIHHDQTTVPYEDDSKIPITLQKELYGEDYMVSDGVPMTAYIDDILYEIKPIKELTREDVLEIMQKENESDYEKTDE